MEQPTTKSEYKTVSKDDIKEFDDSINELSVTGWIHCTDVVTCHIPGGAELPCVNYTQQWMRLVPVIAPVEEETLATTITLSKYSRTPVDALIDFVEKLLALGEFKEIIVSLYVATAMSDIKDFEQVDEDDFLGIDIEDVIYLYGSWEGRKVFVDPHMRHEDNRIFVGEDKEVVVVENHGVLIS